jgi:hypothetical protein
MIGYNQNIKQKTALQLSKPTIIKMDFPIRHGSSDGEAIAILGNFIRDLILLISLFFVLVYLFLVVSFGS